MSFATCQLNQDEFPYSASVSSIEVVSLEYSVEITYPLPEGTSAGFFNFSCMVSGVSHGNCMGL